MKPQGTQLSLFETRSSSDPFAVRVSPRARRLTVRVHVGGSVEIVVPVGVNAKAVREFVQRFSSWINRKVAAMQCLAESGDAVPKQVDFTLTGERFEVHMLRTQKRGLEQRDGRLVVLAPDDAGARAVLQNWLKEAARERLTQPLMQLAGELNFPIARIAIRRQPAIRPKPGNLHLGIAVRRRRNPDPGQSIPGATPRLINDTKQPSRQRHQMPAHLQRLHHVQRQGRRRFRRILGSRSGCWLRHEPDISGNTTGN